MTILHISILKLNSGICEKNETTYKSLLIANANQIV